MNKTETVYDASPCQRLLGAPVAARILEQVARDVGELSRTGPRPRLVSLVFGKPSAAEVYVRNQRRTAETAGIEFVEMAFPETTSEAEAVRAIERLDADPKVTGIILQRPVPATLSVKRLQGAIQPLKDVEGMHPTSIGQIVYGLSDIGPCTALAAVEMLRQTGLRIEGLEVVVIGHSEIVGKPIAFLLMAEGATVTVCHHMTRSVRMHARRADAVFVAVGRPKLVGAEMIKPGAAVIDIGINRVVAEDGQPQLVGDVDFDAVESVAGWLTPVPGGVGLVTRAILMRNTVFAARRQRETTNPAAASDGLDRVQLRNLTLDASIGVRLDEQHTHQPIRISLELEARRGGDGIGVVCYAAVADRIRTLVASQHFRLVEELADRIAAMSLEDARVEAVIVRVEKARAIDGADGAGVEIRRSRQIGAAW